MSITTYAALQSAVADFLDRDDLAAVVPTFIALAEAQMGREVRHYKMQKREAVTLNGRYVSLPSDWVETIRVEGVQDGRPAKLKLASHDDMLELRRKSSGSGAPCAFAHIGDEIEVFPTPDSDYAGEYTYYGAIPALSDAAPSNWLLVMAQDAYLYGALTHAAPYLVEDARISSWGALYQAAVDSINQQSIDAQFSASGLRMRLSNG